MIVRPAEDADRAAIWSILEPVIRTGEAYAVDRDLAPEAAVSWWFSKGHEVFVAEADGELLGTYFLRANQGGGGRHVCNCGYATAAWATGRGVARAMCAHSLEHARAQGFEAMQFNFVIESNERAVRLWKSLGFEVVGRLPRAFRHPRLGHVDALVMHRPL